MFEFALIPLTAVLLASAFAAVSIAWDSERRATRSMGAVFVCIGVWAMIDLFTYVETDAARALDWLRWSHLPPLMIGPSVLWVVAQMLPQARVELEWDARRGAVVFFGIGVAAAYAPGAIVGVTPNSFGGWMPHYGPTAIVLILLGSILPCYAAVQAARIRARASQIRVDKKRAWGVRVGVALAMAIALPTELIFPLLEIPFPRLGALGAACSAAMIWLSVLHDVDELVSTPQGVARSLLAELADGVALVQLDGTILSTNLRFAEMAGTTGGSLLGTSLGSLLDAPLDRVRGGVEDRETTLRPLPGGSVPVALSSSSARSRSGAEIGVVVVVRDLREIDSLRSQLLRSGRLAAIGELAAGIAHEVNNPVAFMRSDLNLLGARIEEVRQQLGPRHGAEGAHQLLDRSALRVSNSLEGIERVAEIVVDVREFAHVGGSGQGGSDFEAVVSGAIRLARLQRGEDVTLRIVNVVGGDRIEQGQELKQVLLTSLRHLADGVEKGGRVEAHLRTDDETLTIALVASPQSKSIEPFSLGFEALSCPVPDVEDEIGLAVAAELVGQLGGKLSLEEVDAKTLRLEVIVPRLASKVVL